MADDNVVPFATPDHTIGDGLALDPDKVLEAAKGDFLQVVVIGFKHDGTLSIRSSHGSRDALWIVKRGEHHLLFETE